MSRFYRLLVMFSFALCCTTSLSAQDGNVKQTRYVYLWDVTASTLNKDEGQFKKISSFLARDIRNKLSLKDATIEVVPFNDKVLGVEKITSAANLEQLVSMGRSLAEEHKVAWNSNPNKADGPGYTNVASAVEFVKDERIRDDWNTVVILLTDGGQEYYSATEHLKSRSKDSNVNKKADDYLLGEIRELKQVIEKTKGSFNRLYYVVTTNEKNDDPRNLDKSGELTNCDQVKCIVASQGSINLHFPVVTVFSASQEAISSRETSFRLNIYNLPEDIRSYVKLTVRVKGVGAKGSDVKNTYAIEKDEETGVCYVDVHGCNFTSLVNSDMTDAKVNVWLALSCSEVTLGEDHYCILLKDRVAQVDVTHKFRPHITVKIKQSNK